MTRIERILQSSRVTLADRDGDRWSDDDLILILSEGHKDLCRHSQILKGRYDIALEPGVVYYSLPEDVWLLQRITYNNAQLPLVSHSYLDATQIASSVRDFGININSQWEDDTGEPEAILYDKRNVGELKVYPIPDDSIYEDNYEFDFENNDGFYGDAAFGVLTELPPYTANSEFGVVSDLVDPFVNDSFNSAFGVVTAVQDNKSRLTCYYIKQPPELTSVNDELLTPGMFDTALKYYVVGHAFMNDLNQEYQAKGAQQLGFYDRELRIAEKTNTRDSTRASQYDTPYRGAF